MKTAAGLVAYAKSKVGNPYWYGTFGQTASESLLQQKKAQYPKHYGDERLKQYRSQFGKQVYDCIGLIKGYVWTSDTSGKIVYRSNGLEDLSADDTLKYACKVKGSMSTALDIPGMLVFMSGHVGIYIGNGEVIEARGFNYGVVKTKLKDRKWTSWGLLDCLDYRSIDINGDGRVNELDFNLYAKIVNSGKPTKEQAIIADLDGDSKITINDLKMFRILAANAGFILKQGDVNRDGKITAADARRILQIAAKLDTPTAEELILGDMNDDNRLTAEDARQILRIVAGLTNVPK